MRGSGRVLVLFAAIVVLLAGTASGQAMLEHAAAAAGGSVAGAAGKSVSNGIDTIFRKLDKQTSTAARTAASPATGAKAIGGTAAIEGVQPGLGAASESARRPRPASPALSPAPPLAVTSSAPDPEASPERPPLTLAEITGIENGTSRNSVLTKLGIPSARITIPDGDSLVEIYRYAASGEGIGVLRLTDGVVSAVRVDAR